MLVPEGLKSRLFSGFHLFYYTVTGCNIIVNDCMYSTNADVFVCVSIPVPGRIGCDMILHQARTTEAINVSTSDECYRLSGPRVTNLFVASRDVVQHSL